MFVNFKFYIIQLWIFHVKEEKIFFSGAFNGIKTGGFLVTEYFSIVLSLSGSESFLFLF